MTTKEWLQRIEASLTRIEDKLDTKAEISALQALEARVRLVETLDSESRGTPAELFRLREEVTKLKTKVYAAIAAIGILATLGELVRQGVLTGR